MYMYVSNWTKFVETQLPFLFSPNLDHVEYYQIARDMAQGMNYLHTHRPAVLHLDLKSGNVLLNRELRAKIADFGFSKLKLGTKKPCTYNVCTCT